MTRKPLLAADFDQDKQVYPALSSPKIDGLRCRIIHSKPMSRSMKLIPNIYLQELVENLGTLLYGLDGELTVGLPNSVTAFQDSTGPLRRTHGQPQVVFNVFDDFSDPSLEFKYRYRNAMTRVQALRSKGHLWIEPVRHKVCRTLDDVNMAEEQALQCGYEGLMLRSPYGRYKSGRSTVNEQLLLKVKRYVDFEAVVTGFEEEMQNTNEARENEVGRMKRPNHSENMIPKNTLGALLGQMVNGPFKGQSISCGSGFTFEERREIWSNREEYLGQVFMVKYFPYGCKDKPRHPTFKGWRPDWDVDSTTVNGGK